MKRLSLVLLVCFNFIYVNAQTSSPGIPEPQPGCGLSESFVKSLGSASLRSQLRQASGNALRMNSGTMTCGRIRFTFNDVVNGIGAGFDHPSMGSAYQQCVCDVATYFQDMFDIPAGDGTPIDIVFNDSWVNGNQPSNPMVLGIGGPIFSEPSYVANVPGFYGGNAYSHFTTGIDPDMNTVDGVITINFNWGYFTCGESITCGVYDFKMLILHEMTHVFGWLSTIGEDSSHIPLSTLGGNRFSKYDKKFLYHGDVQSGVLKHIIDTNAIAIDGTLPAGCLADHKLWFEDTPWRSYSKNQNCLVYTATPSPYSDTPPNSISHLERNQETFMRDGYKAPGFIPEYIMGPYIFSTYRLKGYAPQEIRALNKMGYQFNPVYFAAHQNEILNHHPFTIKNFVDANWYLVPPFPSIDQTDNASGFAPADFTISNCDSVIIDLTLDPDIIDIDAGDPKQIYPSSLYNIRGCGINGNNHNCLTIVPASNGDKVIYKPRPDFIGRAQFGFHLYDGKERGAFMIYTIDVDSCHINTPELVVNGDFEEGMEICQNGRNIFCENANIRHARNLLYEAGFGTHFADGLKYCGWHGMVVMDSHGCDTLNGFYGWPNGSFNSPGSTAIAPPHGGERYFVAGQTYAYFRLHEPVYNCSIYKLEFDFATENDSMVIFNVGFTDSPQPFNYAPTILSPVSFTYTGSPRTWIHKVLDIPYCDTILSRYLVFENMYWPNGPAITNFDNMSLQFISSNCNACITTNSDIESNGEDLFVITDGSEKLQIQFLRNEKHSIELFNTLGQLIYSEHSNESIITLDKSKLPFNILLLRCTSGNNFQTKRISLSRP